MKANVFRIVLQHYDSFRNDKKQFMLSDLLLFVILPLAVAAIFLYNKFTFSSEALSAAITIFSIFSALLLSVQMALFAIHQSDWKDDGDTKLNDLKIARKKMRNQLIGELNTNISYVNIVLILSITIILLSMVSKNTESGLFIFFLIAIYIHFLLNIFMIIKRAHALFKTEYEAQ